MKTKKFLMAAVAALIVALPISGSVLAQKPVKPKLQEKKENIEAMKVAYITKKMNLTSDEAKKFWPVYNEFESKKKELNKSAVTKYNKILTDSLTDQQATEMIDQQIIHAQKMLDLRKEYLVKFKQVVSSKKIAKMYEAEKNFRKLLLKEIKDRRNDMRKRGE